MSATLERVLAEVVNLSAEERRVLLDALSAATPRASRAAAADGPFGKYSHVRTSSEEFCARKALEVALEEDRRARDLRP